MIPLFKVFMASSAGQAVARTLDSGFISQGPKVEEFEEALRRIFDHPYILTLNSATAGLTLALRLLQTPDVSNTADVWPGIDVSTDCVLTTPLTCTATNWPIMANNMKLRWVDVDPKTCNMDLDDLERKITRHTKVILIVHWGGTPVDLGRLDDILDRKKAELGFRPRVVEDCAHAFMSKYRDKYIGTHGNMCVFSLQAIKHMTTGDGGLLFVPNSSLYERGKLLRWYGIDRDQRNYSRKDFRMEHDIEEWGYKFHMNDINATIGLCNLPHAADIISKHREHAHVFKQALSSCSSRTVSALLEAEGVESAYWLFTLMCDDAEKFISFMKDRGVTASQVHKRNDVHSCMREFACELPQLDAMQHRYVCVPVGWWLTQDDIQHIKNSLLEYAST